MMSKKFWFWLYNKCFDTEARASTLAGRSSCYLKGDGVWTFGLNSNCALSSLKSKLWNFVERFTSLGSNISFTEIDVSIHKGKEEASINKLTDITSSRYSCKSKSCQFYCWTNWIWIKRLRKRVDGNYSRIWRVVLKKIRMNVPEIAVVWLFTSHFWNHPSKTNRIEIERQHFSLPFFLWTHQLEF